MIGTIQTKIILLLIVALSCVVMCSGEDKEISASPIIKKVYTDTSRGLEKQEKNILVSIETQFITDDTPIIVELVPINNKTVSIIRQQSVLQNNHAQISLPIPKTLDVGHYQFHIVAGSLQNPIASHSDQTYQVLRSGKRIFYISSTDGNDANDGLSAQKPIKTLQKASEIELMPGESLLLKAGDIWTGESLFPKGTGTEENPITITSYNEGPKPRIVPGIGQQMYGIRLVNISGYRIIGLEISNCYGGIVAWTENTYNHRFLWIENCFFHDITGKDTGFCVAFYKNLPPDLLYGTGIMIAGSDAVGGSTLFSDITITKCDFDCCDVGIELLPRDHDQSGIWDQHRHDIVTCEAYRRVTIRHCNILRSYRTGGVMLYCVRDGVAEHLLIDQTGYQEVGMFWGVAAFQCARVSDFVIQKCTFSNTIKGKSPDGQGFDFEADCHRILLKDSCIVGNDGPAILFFGGTWKGTNEDNVIDGCFLKNNNRTREFYNNTFAVMHPDNSGVVRNTTIHLCEDEQGFYCHPLKFEASNRVYGPSGNSKFGNDPMKP
ncbi:MAG: hypothetical protein LBI18_00085 [Planctomycetaceae bacterium]|jgi:hypothetical protein|nr:hypothetical protein [Planctomycetaceae bacterium]